MDGIKLPRRQGLKYGMDRVALHVKFAPKGRQTRHTGSTSLQVHSDIRQ